MKNAPHFLWGAPHFEILSKWSTFAKKKQSAYGRAVFFLIGRMIRSVERRITAAVEKPEDQRKPERFFGHRKAFAASRCRWQRKEACNFRSGRKTRGIAACRCQWQMQAGRNFRSRAIGGPSRSRPGNGNAARRASASPKCFPGTARRHLTL
jgi:hypothetical protein